MSTPTWVGPMVPTTQSPILLLLMLPMEPPIPLIPSLACLTTQASPARTRKSWDINNNLPKYRTALILPRTPILTISIHLGRRGRNSPPLSRLILLRLAKLQTERTLMEIAQAHPNTYLPFCKVAIKWKGLSLWLTKDLQKMWKQKVPTIMATLCSKTVQKELLGWANSLKWKRAIF